jgi:predicted dienelactone hydrolase
VLCLAPPRTAQAQTAAATPGDTSATASADGTRWSRPGPVDAPPSDETWTDAARSRSLPIRLRVPVACAAPRSAPVIVFSHGLGGSRDGAGLWAERWASHGLAVVHLQHPGSDESIWRGQPGGFSAANLMAGMTAATFVDRIADVHYAIDEIVRRAGTDPAWRCVDPGRIGMSGHSFGAITTQAIAGQRLGAAASRSARDARIGAALALSPSPRLAGAFGADAFADVTLPFLAITGTRDQLPGFADGAPEQRAAIFDALPAGGKYVAVYREGDHMVFGGHPMRRAPTPTDLRIQHGVAQLTTAFWLAHLAGDAQAWRWLETDLPGEADRGLASWRRK